MSCLLLGLSNVAFMSVVVVKRTKLRQIVLFEAPEIHQGVCTLRAHELTGMMIFEIPLQEFLATQLSLYSHQWHCIVFRVQVPPLLQTNMLWSVFYVFYSRSVQNRKLAF